MEAISEWSRESLVEVVGQRSQSTRLVYAPTGVCTSSSSPLASKLLDLEKLHFDICGGARAPACPKSATLAQARLFHSRLLGRVGSGEAVAGGGVGKVRLMLVLARAQSESAQVINVKAESNEQGNLF